MDCPKLFVPESSVDPIPKPSSFPRAAAAWRRSSTEPVVDQLEHHVERGRIVAGVVDAAVRSLVRHLLRLDVVALPDIHGVEPELGRDDVDDSLCQPQVLHPRVPAVRRHRRLVGADLREVDLDVPPAVQARRHLRPDDAAERLVARERPAVVEGAHLEAGHRAVGLHRDLDVQKRALVPVRVRHVLVRAPLGPLDGATELPREQAQDDELRMEADLVAEASPDVLRNEAELVDPGAQGRRHPDRADTGHLVIAVDRPLPHALVELDERARALERRRGEPVEVESLDLHDVVRLCQRCVSVTPFEDARPHDVRAGFVVEDHLVLERLRRVDENRKLVVLDLDELGCVARELARGGADSSDWLALVTDAARRRARSP